jgi:transposase
MLCVGIDVASEKHDCAILNSETGEICDTFVFENNRAGFNARSCPNQVKYGKLIKNERR